MVTVEINVTKKDIGNGVCKDPGNCPVARAAIRAGFKDVDAFRYYLYFTVRNEYGNNEYLSVGLPKKVSNFIAAFDHGEPVKPFKFLIKLRKAVVKQFKLRKSALVSA